MTQVETEAPPPNPIADFEDFFKLFEENSNLKYRQKISDMWAKSYKHIEVFFEDVLMFDGTLANYLKNQPIRAIYEAIDALKNVLRIDAGGLLNSDDEYFVQIGSQNDVLLEKIEDICEDKIEKLIEVDCEVIGIVPPYNIYKEIVFECPTCGNLMREVQLTKDIFYPKECTNPNCKHNKDFRIIDADSQHTRIQYAQVREINKRTNANLKILIPSNLIGTINTGDRAKIFGIYKTEILEARTGKKKNRSIPYIQVNNIICHGTHPHQQILSDGSRIYLEEKDGIYLDEMKECETKTEILFSWDDFQIHHKFTIQQGPTKEFRFIGHIRIKNDVHGFYNANIEQIKQVLQKNCAVSGKNINFCTMPLQSFLSKFKDESEKVTYVIGFTKEGWKLPINSICLVQDHIGNEIHANLQNVFEKRHDFEDVKMKFRELYEKTGIAHKDQLFQWAIFSPFLYAYREIGGIMPALVLQGPAQTGKSRFLEMILKNWYGHLKEVQNGDSIGSSSRLESIIAGSTLPIIIDDCTNAHEWIVDVLKSYLTLESNFLRKGAGVGGQFATVNKPLCAPLAISCNEPPNWFSDDAFLERVYLEIIDACEQKEGWNEIRDQIPRGSILQILYEMSKEWDLSALKKIVKSIKIPADIKDDSRKKYVYCAFAIGQKILKEIFGIDTKLDQIIHVLNRTRSTNMDSLRALIDHQIEHGVYKKRKTSVNFDFKETVEFFPSTWIRHPICNCRFEDDNEIKRESLAFNINNLRDLQAQFEGNNTKKWTLQTFLIKIQKQFPNAKIGKFYCDCYNENGDLDNKIVRCVAIPKSDLCRI